MRVRGLVFALTFALVFYGVLGYQRPLPRKNIVMRESKDKEDYSPQQVHISMVGADKMRIQWVGNTPTPATVEYGTTPGAYGLKATGSTSSYKYLLYESDPIHDVVIGPLKPDTVYYYRCGSDKEFSFKTPPSQFPIKFAVVGDLGQTEWTKSTLQHIEKSNYSMLILPGDLSYADTIQSMWDSYGRLVEPLASQRPWMVTIGNHEIEKLPLIHKTPFTAFNARYHMPFEESGSPSNPFYSFDVAGVHFIMLGSYTESGPGSEQYKWLQSDLAKINKQATPWTVVVVHAPWYNTNKAHQGESESVDMRKSMEELIYKARVDVVFAGHVHAYERFGRVYNYKIDNCAPVYITIGDGGNREGLASKYDDPKPDISLFREASFGHGEFDFMNATDAKWTWHRNDDDETVASDSFLFKSLASDPACKL